MNNLRKVDPAVYELIREEEKRQRDVLEHGLNKACLVSVKTI